jgi:hypothetical protein
MNKKFTCTLRKQLKREQLHVVWLEQHLPPTHVSSTVHSSESQSCVCWKL